MAKVKVVSEFPLYNGMAITFNAPCDCTAVDGLTVSYSGEFQDFTFRDAHNNDLTGIGNLFSEGAFVKVILDTNNGAAYIQNADTNSYFEAIKRENADMGRCASGAAITLQDATNAPVAGLRIFGHAVGDGCIGDKGDITVKFAGKNLFHHRLDLEPMADTKGTCTLLEVLDNGVIIQGNGTTGNTSWSNGWYIPAFDWGKQVPLKKGDVVTISADYTMLENVYVTTTNVAMFLIGAADQTEGKQTTVAVGEKKRVSTTYTVKADGNYRCTITLNSGKVKIENVQIEYGTTATDYEPYREPQTITVPTPGGLEGDELVQDEINFEKGVLIRRVFESSETPLPANVLDAYSKLKTYDVTTKITNDEDAEMEVRYCTPVTAVPLVHSPADAGKVLSINEGGRVVPTNELRELGNKVDALQTANENLSLDVNALNERLDSFEVLEMVNLTNRVSFGFIEGSGGADLTRHSVDCKQYVYYPELRRLEISLGFSFEGTMNAGEEMVFVLSYESDNGRWYVPDVYQALSCVTFGGFTDFDVVLNNENGALRIRAKSDISGARSGWITGWCPCSGESTPGSVG